MSKREHFDHYMCRIMDVVATRATCPRRQVGCVIINANKHIIATGYNGVPPKYPHCTEEPCGGQHMKSGTGLQTCMATHAEQNALMQCKDIHDIHTIYVSTTPCPTCAKLIAGTSCKRVVCRVPYSDRTGENIMRDLGIEVDYIGKPD